MGKKYYLYDRKDKFYAVRKGRNPGIYFSWLECKSQIHRYPGAVYKSFECLESAENYMDEYREENENRMKFSNYAYIRGYYNDTTDCYGYNGCIYHNNKKYNINGYDNDPHYINMGAVAGHIVGCRKLIDKAIELGIRNMDLYYDYEGIKNWATGDWNRNKYGSIEYYEYMQDIKRKININFIKNIESKKRKERNFFYKTHKYIQKKYYFKKNEY